MNPLETAKNLTKSDNAANPPGRTNGLDLASAQPRPVGTTWMGCLARFVARDLSSHTTRESVYESTTKQVLSQCSFQAPTRLLVPPQVYSRRYEKNIQKHCVVASGFSSIYGAPDLPMMPASSTSTRNLNSTLHILSCSFSHKSSKLILFSTTA